VDEGKDSSMKIFFATPDYKHFRHVTSGVFSTIFKVSQTEGKQEGKFDQEVFFLAIREEE
jgi:hypothetical protein